MSGPHDPMVEAALRAYWEPSSDSRFTDIQLDDMRRALAAAYRAEADALGPKYSGTGVVYWLRQRAAELDGQSDGERG